MNDSSDSTRLEQQRRFYDTKWGASAAVHLESHEVMRLAKILDAFARVMDDLDWTSNAPAICDLGCGRGWLSAQLASFGRVTGVDLSPEGTRRAAERWPNISFEAADVTTWRSQTVFDVVVSSEVIEHVPDKAAFAATVDAILRPGGYLILTTPTGKAKRAYFARGFKPQVIEDWLSPSDLAGLFSPRFAILRHETFEFEFGHSGIYRLANSVKLLKAIDALGLAHLYDGLRRTAGLGLYQILLARKRPITG